MTEDKHLLIAGLYRLISNIHLHQAGVRPLTMNELILMEDIAEWWEGKYEQLECRNSNI